LEGYITSWNQSAERLFGESAAAMLGKPLSTLYPPDQPNILTENILNLLNQDGLYENEIRLRHESGNLFHAHLALSPLKDRDGEIIGLIAAIRDITERKIMENELIRTSKLESVSVLAGGIAHDFNNLLTAILGNIAMASLNADGKTFVQERLAEAEKACLRAQNLTRQLLAFSKGEKPQKKLISLRDLLKTSASLMLRSSNVRRHVYLPEDLWWVEVDEEQINQAINHLLINADQAMPQGGAIHILAENVRISEKSQVPLRSGKYVKISIQDQGIGIPPEHLDKVFDPFFTTKRRGTGLGLSTVYTIIRNHDGHITLESTPHGGSTFIIYLPASRKKGVLPKDKTLKISFGRGKILLMDDEEMILEVSSAMLKRLGYDVTVAQDGAEAIAYFLQAADAGVPFDAVILDLTVPGGLGAKETIGDLQQINPQAKVIVSSGFSDDPLKTEFSLYGFSGFMPKPYNLTQLSAVIHKILK
jgi:two-component system cell cycle sensor histidine kinase/response regulator CckA